MSIRTLCLCVLCVFVLGVLDVQVSGIELLPDDVELLLGWFRWFSQMEVDLDVPSDVRQHVLDRAVWMQRRERHLAIHEPVTSKIRDDRGRTGTGHSEIFASTVTR